MKKLLAYTTAVVLLAGSLVGCGNRDTEESKTATETSIETQAETEETVETTRANSKDGWGGVCHSEMCSIPWSRMVRTWPSARE